MTEEITTNEAAQPVPESITEQREQSQGYVPLQADRIKGMEPPPEEEPQTLEEAAEDLSASRTPESAVVSYGPVDDYLSQLPANVSISLEQSLEMQAQAREIEAKAAEEAEAEILRAEVDAARGAQAEQALPDDVRAMIETGVDPEVARAISHPQVREALETEFTKADQVREQYATGLEQARISQIAALAEVVPHLTGLDPSRFVEGLQVLQQVDPPAFQQAMNILGRTNQIVQAQQQAHQQQAQVYHQQFEQYGKSEDAKFRAMLGNDQAKMNEAGTEVAAYIDELGIGRDRLAHLLRTDPTIRSAEGQRILVDAAKYRAMQKAMPKPTHRPTPTLKPGTSNAVRTSAPSAKIAALEKALEGASGDKAARISAQIWGLQKQAKG